MTNVILLSLLAATMPVRTEGQSEEIAPCSDTEFTLFFPQGQTRLTPEAEHALDAELEKAAACDIDQIIVTGHSELRPSERPIRMLAVGRAGSVANEIANSEAVYDTVIVRSAGTEEALITAGVLRPINRRVVVQMELSPTT